MFHSSTIYRHAAFTESERACCIHRVWLSMLARLAYRDAFTYPGTACPIHHAWPRLLRSECLVDHYSMLHSHNLVRHQGILHAQAWPRMLRSHSLAGTKGILHPLNLVSSTKACRIQEVRPSMLHSDSQAKPAAFTSQAEHVAFTQIKGTAIWLVWHAQGHKHVHLVPSENSLLCILDIKQIDFCQDI